MIGQLHAAAHGQLTADKQQRESGEHGKPAELSRCRCDKCRDVIEMGQNCVIALAANEVEYRDVHKYAEQQQQDNRIGTAEQGVAPLERTIESQNRQHGRRQQK